MPVCPAAKVPATGIPRDHHPSVEKVRFRGWKRGRGRYLSQSRTGGFIGFFIGINWNCNAVQVVLGYNWPIC